MNQIHQQRESGPGFGRVFVTTVISLGALVGVGLAFYAWNGSGSETSTADRDHAANSVPDTPTFQVPVGPVQADPSGTASGDAMSASSVIETDTASRPLDAGRTADLDAGAPSSSASSDSVRPAFDSEDTGNDMADASDGDQEDVLDLTDIERPVAYADAEALFQRGQYAEARRYFSAYVEDHGDNAWGFYMLGLSNLKAGFPEAAEGAFLAALDIDPEHQKSLVNLARARMELADYSEALLPVERARELAPENRDAARVYARALHNLGRSTDAADVYMELLTRQPEDVWSMNNLGLIRIEKEEFTLAVPPLARAVELDSTVAVFQNNLGIALERIGDFDGASTAYAQAVGIDGGYERAQTNLDRVTALRPSQSREPLDLATYAAEFVEELSRIGGGPELGDALGVSEEPSSGHAVVEGDLTAMPEAPSR